MKVAIMQPYFMPYIGYFQLINAVDTFVIYDNIQYTKKGWINRNRILENGKDTFITLPLSKDSDYLDVVARKLASDFNQSKMKLVNKISACYKKAPQFNNIFPIITDCLNHQEENLFEFILYSLKAVNTYLNIDTKIVISSTIHINHQLKNSDKVIALCKALDATEYINPSGGKELYDVVDFKENGIDLKFIQSEPIQYPQFSNEFVPWLSIIDVLMFNDKIEIRKMLNQFSLS